MNQKLAKLCTDVPWRTCKVLRGTQMFYATTYKTFRRSSGAALLIFLLRNIFWDPPSKNWMGAEINRFLERRFHAQQRHAQRNAAQRPERAGRSGDYAYIIKKVCRAYAKSFSKMLIQRWPTPPTPHPPTPKAGGKLAPASGGR